MWRRTSSSISIWPLCHSGFVATLIDNKEFIINLIFLFLLDIPRNIPSHSHNSIAHLVLYVRLLSTHTTRTVISHSRCALPFHVVERERSDRSCVMFHLLSSGKRVKGQWIFCYFCKIIRRIFMTAQIVWNYLSRFFFEKNAKCFISNLNLTRSVYVTEYFANYQKIFENYLFISRIFFK